jgi:predicted  nucleic acid-binding Zn-ribbon protein
MAELPAEGTTGQLPGSQSFESRVLSALQDINARLERLESKQYDTKPIWERALAEILSVQKRLDAVDVRLDRIESEVKMTHSEFYELRADFKEMRGHMKEPA